MELPAEQWIALARKIKAFTSVQMMCLAGGEPLLYGELDRLVAGLSELEIHSVVVTNGWLLDEARCDRLVEAGLPELNVSLDAFAELHDQMRGLPGVFDRCMRAVRYIKENHPSVRVGVSTLICQRNLAQLPELVEWLSTTPVDLVNLQAYNQLVNQQLDWSQTALLRDPLWPQDPARTAMVLKKLKAMAETNDKLVNPPSQFDQFAAYFENPDRDLGVRCPAGTFNFPCSHDGNVTPCIVEAPVANILEHDPVEAYRDRFPAIRAKARGCRENCHFLVNCLYSLSLEPWDEVDGDPAPGLQEPKPGPARLPPEIRTAVVSERGARRGYLSYEQHAAIDTIGKIDSLDGRYVPTWYQGDVPCVYLAGDTSEVHRWAVGLDENDWFKQMGQLIAHVKGQDVYHTVLGVRRTNLHRLPRMIDIVRHERGQPPLEIAPLDLREPRGVKRRFHEHLERLNRIGRPEGIELLVDDPDLGRLLDTMEAATTLPGYRQKDYLMALGPVCKDVFTGPAYLLLDLCGRCNVDCIYCRQFSPLVDPDERKTWTGAFDVWSLQQAEQVLDMAKRLEVELILLVGRGEPTLHPRFPDVMRAVIDRGFKFGVTTNGALLHRGMGEYLSGHCTSITVSLSFASEETFRKIRPGTKVDLCRQIERNVRRLSDARGPGAIPPRISALYAINSLNYHEIVEMARHAHRIGADRVWYQLVHLSDFSRDKLYLDPELMGEIRDKLRQAKEVATELGLGWSAFIDFELDHYDEARGDWSREGMLHQGCYVGWHFAFVDLLRYVFFCCGNQTVGDLEGEHETLEEMWYSDIWRRYRNDALVLHRENPVDLKGKPFYNDYCESCDNHDQQMTMLELLDRYSLRRFVER